MRLVKSSAVLLTILAAACGGGRGGGTEAPPAPVSLRGTLVQSPPALLSTLTASNLLLQLNLAANQPLLALSGTPLCDVLYYDIQYNTVGGAGEPTTASAALMLPTGLGSRCTGARPVLLYAHGTSTDRAFNMTNLQNAETLSLTALFASQGYIVVAPNYAGYDTSTLPYHPYLLADQQSKDMIDALTAARTALPLASATLTRDDGRLFVTGYSQGGFVAMATHRALQAAGAPVTASAPMSGPYALAAFVDAIFSGEVDGGATASSTLLFTAYQRAYGNIYATAADVFTPQYAAGIESLLPSATPRSQLYATGRLPEYALFSSTPPAAQFAALTPPAMPADLAPVFALGFGAANLLQNSYRLGYLLDATANPDGGWPVTGTGVPPATPSLRMRQALKTNDLREWLPKSPVQLCGADLDPVVFWFNTRLMQQYWAAHPPSAAVSVIDLETPPTTGDPHANLESAFALAKELVAAQAVAAGATDGGALAVAEAYHATLVAPLCFAAARAFFSAF